MIPFTSEEKFITRKYFIVGFLVSKILPIKRPILNMQECFIVCKINNIKPVLAI